MPSVSKYHLRCKLDDIILRIPDDKCGNGMAQLIDSTFDAHFISGLAQREVKSTTLTNGRQLAFRDYFGEIAV
jgi:hypothetical protein